MIGSDFWPLKLRGFGKHVWIFEEADEAWKVASALHCVCVLCAKLVCFSILVRLCDESSWNGGSPDC